MPVALGMAIIAVSGAGFVLWFLVAILRRSAHTGHWVVPTHK